ncbi:MAG: TolC family protein [Ignavibacteria bacterium]|nr:TolC family protein [Ignavibacteria bacterium]
MTARIIVLLFWVSIVTMPAQTIDSLISAGLTHSYSLKELSLKRRANELRAKQLDYLPAPSLALEFSQVPVTSPNIFTQALSQSVSFSQMLPLGGKLSAMQKAENSALVVIGHEERMERVTISSSIQMQVLKIAFLRSKGHLLLELADFYKASRGAASVTYASGRLNSTDVYMAEALLAESEQQLFNNEKEISTEEKNLQNLTQTDGGWNKPLLEFIPDISNYIPDTSTSGAVDRNPDLHAMSAMIDMKKAEAAANRRELIPDLMLQAMVMRMPKGMIVTTAMPGEMLTGSYSPEYMFSIMASVTLPFMPWASGKIEYRTEELLAESERVAESRKKMSQNMQSSFNTYYTQYKQGMEFLQIYKTRVLPAMEKAVTNATQLYGSGSVTFMQYVEYKKMLSMERMNYLMKIMECKMAIVNLMMSVGNEEIIRSLYE